MNLDPVSIITSLVLSSFGFLVFLLWNKKSELNIIEKRVSPAAKETQDALIKNFLSFGEIPSKSKLISIITSVARKHQVQLISYLPIPSIIDNLVYYVISNDLLDPYRKKEISDSLIQLKMEPISSVDYTQIYSDLSEWGSWKQKLVYGQLIKILIISSSALITLGIATAQLGVYLGSQVSYVLERLLTTTIGFCVLLAFFTLFTVVKSLYLNSNNKKTEEKAKNPVEKEDDYESKTYTAKSVSSSSVQNVSNPRKINKPINKPSINSNFISNTTTVGEMTSPSVNMSSVSSYNQEANKATTHRKNKTGNSNRASNTNRSEENTFEVI